MDTNELVKCAQLDLMVELDRICKKWDIPYFLTAGTLIGAVRHNGFIPWDDDLDVGILWEDYARLKEACEQDLDPAYYLHSWDSDPSSPHPFYKLKIRGTHYPEQIAVKSQMDDGIFIDIFPFDNAPDDPKLRKKQHRERIILRKFLLLRAGFDLGGKNLAKKLVYVFLKAIAYMRPMSAWKKSFTKLRNRYNRGKTREAVNLCGAYAYEKECQRREILEEVVLHKFEDQEFCIPANYDEFLTRCYGNYMQPPPEAQRVGIHHVQNVDLGDYQIRCR